MAGPFQNVPYSVPLAVPVKGSQYLTYNHYSMSPPECDGSISSSASGAPSYSNSSGSGLGASSTSYYLGSGSNDYESAHSASGIDFQEYMQDRFSNTFNPIPLDRSMAVQAQT